MIGDPNRTDLEKVSLHLLIWFLVQLDQHKRVRLDVVDQLLLLFEDEFEILSILLKRLLVLKLFYQLEF